MTLVLLAPLRVAPVHAIYCDPGDTICDQLNNSINTQVDAAQRLQDIQNRIKDVQERINALVQLVRDLDGQIAAQQALIDRTQTQIDELDRQIRFTMADITRQQAHIDVRDRLLAQRVRFLDNHGSVNYMQLVVTATSFNQLVDRIVIMQEIIRSDRQLLDELRGEREQLAGMQDQLNQQRAQETALLKKQQDEKAQLDGYRGTQAKALASVQALSSQLEKQRQLLEQQKLQIDSQVAALQQQYDAEMIARGGGNGQFMWPMQPNSFYISQGFGCVTFWMELYNPNCPYPHRFHSGLDMAGPYGNPIYAADTGVVTMYSSGYGYGNYVIMVHGRGYETVYGHMAGFNPKVSYGQIVARGTLIGYEGSTGWSTGAHLHFEIRLNGGYQNPCTYLGC